MPSSMRKPCWTSEGSSWRNRCLTEGQRRREIRVTPQEQALSTSREAAERALREREARVEQAARTLADTKAQQAARAARLDELAAALETRTQALRAKGAAVSEAQQQQAVVRRVSFLEVFRSFSSMCITPAAMLCHYAHVCQASTRAAEADKTLARREAQVHARAAELDQAQRALDERTREVQQAEAALRSARRDLEAQRRVLDESAAALDSQRRALAASQQDAQALRDGAGMALEAKGRALEEAAAALEAQQEQVLYIGRCV